MRFAIIALLILGLVGLAACEPDDKAKDQRNTSIDTRAEVFDRAQALWPIPQNVNFPLRQALLEFTTRQDEINHPWYIYVTGDNGNTIGYYVAKTVPINACNFLSSTEDITNGGVVTAPSLDGIFYGGGGASGACDAWFFFDYATNALIQTRQRFVAIDQPLKIDVQPIEVATTGTP